jgi:predicted DCC family thiol-disulfide oxidoreductase YuxK
MVTPSPIPELVVLYDGLCGFCTRSVEWIRARDPEGRVLALPNQTPGLREQFGLSRAEVDRQLYAVGNAGAVYGGAAAFFRIFRALGGVWAKLAWIYRVPGIPWCSALVYFFVARNRGRLARWGVTPTCERSGATCRDD